MSIDRPDIPSVSEQSSSSPAAVGEGALAVRAQFAERLAEPAMPGTLGHPLRIDPWNAADAAVALLSAPPFPRTVLSVGAYEPVLAVYDAQARRIGLLDPLGANARATSAQAALGMFTGKVARMGFADIGLQEEGYVAGEDGALAETPLPSLEELHAALADALDGKAVVLLEDNETAVRTHRERLAAILAAHGRALARFDTSDTLEDVLALVEADPAYGLALSDTNVYRDAASKAQHREAPCGPEFMRRCVELGIPLVASGAQTIDGIANTPKQLAYEDRVSMAKFLRALGR